MSRKGLLIQPNPSKNSLNTNRRLIRKSKKRRNKSRKRMFSSGLKNNALPETIDLSLTGTEIRLLFKQKCLKSPKNY
jgi:hypothetical protein